MSSWRMEIWDLERKAARQCIDVREMHTSARRFVSARVFERESEEEKSPETTDTQKKRTLN